MAVLMHQPSYELDENKQGCDIEGALLSNVDGSFKWGVRPTYGWLIHSIKPRHCT